MSSEISCMRLWESTESVEYSGLVNVSPGNTRAWLLPGLDITGCRMDIQEDDTWCLLQLLCNLHNSREHTWSYCRLYREGCSRSGLTRGSLSEQCVV